jgi:small conductance mechanosensitive channel
MEILQTFFEYLKPVVPTGVALVIGIVVLYAVRFILDKRYAGSLNLKFRRQVMTILLSFAGLLAIIMVLPIDSERRGQLLSLLGILLSAAIALSSTTILGNAMAGFMLRAIRNFRPGDFIEVGEHFGRVSDRGLFHVEIQKEDRDLVTIPNIYLVTNAVKVSRSSGTIVSADVSLGYDVAWHRVDKLLLSAGEAAGLEEPFTQVLELGDFSVTYRVAGLLRETREIISARSRLREAMLDKLHEGGVEIVSPTFMNTRALSEGHRMIPQVKAEEDMGDTSVPEELVFDKADKAESLEKMKERYERFGKEIDEIKKRLSDSDAAYGSERDALKGEMNRLEASRKRLAEVIEKREEEKEP